MAELGSIQAIDLRIYTQTNSTILHILGPMQELSF